MSNIKDQITFEFVPKEDHLKGELRYVSSTGQVSGVALRFEYNEKHVPNEIIKLIEMGVTAIEKRIQRKETAKELETKHGFKPVSEEQRERNIAVNLFSLEIDKYK